MSVIDIIALWIGHAVLLYAGFITAVLIVASAAAIILNGAKAIGKLFRRHPTTEGKEP